MESSFHYLLMINQALFKKMVLSQLSGLTSGQPKILEYLSEHDGSIQKDIARGCQIEPATLTTLLKSMEDQNLIERRMINQNRRSNFVFLTKLGREKSEQVETIFNQAENEAFEGISAADKEQFLNTFQKICNNLTITERHNESKRTI
ncbi:MarR family transcriptional regulator [Eubacteriaceae bacterium ES2]|nr:MarR family transcriptional regulator [Eubacteriaceae bacterium ES2]